MTLSQPYRVGEWNSCIKFNRGGNTSWDYGTIDFGIIWNYFWNSTKFCIKFHWNSWNYIGITARWEISIISPSNLTNRNETKDKKNEKHGELELFEFFLSFFVCFPREVGVKDELESESLRLLHDSKLSGFESREIYNERDVCCCFF